MKLRQVTKWCQQTADQHLLKSLQIYKIFDNKYIDYFCNLK